MAIKAMTFRDERHPNLMALVNEYAEVTNNKRPALAIEMFLISVLPSFIAKKRAEVKKNLT